MTYECKSDCFRNLIRYNDWAPTILRVIVGFFFAMHGAGKLWGPRVGIGGGFEGFRGLITGMLGMPVFFAHLVAWAELLVGIFLVIGIMTRYSSIVGIIIMFVAAVFVHIPSDGGFLSAETPMLFIAAFISLLITGPGRLSLEQWAAKASGGKKIKR